MAMKKIRRNQAGFSLLEMLLVANFIFLMMGVMMPIIEHNYDKSHDSVRANDLKSVQAALSSYKRVHGVYPTTNGVWMGDPLLFGGFGYNVGGYVPGLVPDFMQTLPKDPSEEFPSNWQGYMYLSDGTDFKFMAFGTPTEYPTGHPFIDNARPNVSWAVSSPGASWW